MILLEWWLKGLLWPMRFAMPPGVTAAAILVLILVLSGWRIWSRQNARR